MKEKYSRGLRLYSCRNTKFNYVSYVQEGSENKINYIAYSGDGEKSSGVFGATGLSTETEQQMLKAKLRKTDSVIWHGFISFAEGFGQKYVGSVEDAIRLMSTEMPVFLRDAGFTPENVVWYTGLHENTLKKADDITSNFPVAQTGSNNHTYSA